MRGHAIRQKVQTPFGSLYGEVEFDGNGSVTGIAIAHPSKHRDTAVGDALEALSDTINSIIADSRAGRSSPEVVAAFPSAAAQVLPETGRAVPSGAPGRFFVLPQGEQPFEGNGE